jgi:uncharacterized protein (DUF885 family)
MAHDQLTELLQQDFAHQHSDNPEFASQSGVHLHDARLQDLSPAAFDKRAEYDADILKRAAALDPNELTEQEQLTLRLFIDNVKTEAEAFALGCHLFPINSIGYGGVVLNFVEALDW